jgi:hypothetical protein
MVVDEGHGIPLGIHVTSATPAEVTLVAETLRTIRVPRVGGGSPRQNSPHLIGDRGYDSDAVGEALARRGIVCIVPYRDSRIVRRFEDKRQLRRYCHRWIVERAFARLGPFSAVAGSA